MCKRDDQAAVRSTDEVGLRAEADRRAVTAEAAPRIYCVPATQAPVVAVFRRGPSDWAHIGRWDLAQGRYEPGAWLRGRVFPRRSDVSPDGRLLCYFAHKPGAGWQHGDTYVALSKLPWMTALHAFATCGTWTRGYHFTEDGSDEEIKAAKLPMPYGLRATSAVQFATERRRGWEETADSPARDSKDMWDQYRNARMQKRQPGGSGWLRVESLGWAGGEFGIDQAVDGLRVRYALGIGDRVEWLDDIQWADWDGEGRLLVATRAGTLQVRAFDGERIEVVFEKDLSRLKPDPVPAPPWAERW